MRRLFRPALFCLLLVSCGSSSGGATPGGAGSDGGSSSGGTSTGGVGSGGSVGTAGSAENVGGSAAGAAGSGTAGTASETAVKRAPYATHIACNSARNFVVLADGRSYAWFGTRGDYDSSYMYAQVSAGGDEGCYLLKDGTIVCLGTGSAVDKHVPAGKFTEIRVGAVTGAAAACARNAAGVLTCWGEDSDPIVAQAPTGPVTAFDVSSLSACAIAVGGAVSCWGTSQLAAPTNRDFTSIYANAPFACGISSAGAMTCWTFTTIATPDIEQLSIGAAFACGIQTGGHGFCIGRKTGGEVPQPPAGTSFTEITTADSRACGILVDGSVICWGTSPNDQLVQPPPDPIRAF